MKGIRAERRLPIRIANAKGQDSPQETMQLAQKSCSDVQGRYQEQQNAFPTAACLLFHLLLSFRVLCLDALLLMVLVDGDGVGCLEEDAQAVFGPATELPASLKLAPAADGRRGASRRAVSADEGGLLEG